MKKKIIIITFSKEVGLFYKNQFQYFFGDLVEFVNYSLDEERLYELEEADIYYVGTTSSDDFEHVVSLVEDKEKIVASRLTFRRKDLDKLKSIPPKTKALLINLSYNMAIETLVDLNRNDINHIKFYPMGPDGEPEPNVNIAVTPGEKRFVPQNIKKVIDIGHRVISESVIIEIAFKLGFNWVLNSEKYKTYVDELAEQNYSINALTVETVSINNRFEILIESMDIGIIGTDADRRISVCNKMAESILQKNRHDLIGNFLWEVHPQFKGMEQWMNKKGENLSKLIHINGIALSATVAQIIWKKSFNGYFLLLQRFNEEESKHQKLKVQFYERGHTSKYVFEDIVGNCPQMVKAKDIAKKMALTDASILLTGESGTGKELFAHSIHNASKRKNMPFVAINCAALPETLLESELFGYSEGAFTGAKKGGKLGLFEYAHKGTLFLDEIEGMSHTLQIKLLRVLQEKEIMRIGENKIIPIDVRIIAASNENILAMVKEGKFRKDLYYRINTLPIDIPPLSQRGEDIFLLTEKILCGIGAKYTLSNEAKAVFKNYCWDGNVRELKNILEYLKFMDKEVIEPEDLPNVMMSEENFVDKNQEIKKDFNMNWEKALTILKIINENPEKSGRRSIYNKFLTMGYGISEGEIRILINKLNILGYINTEIGRKGNILTLKGKDVINGVEWGK